MIARAQGLGLREGIEIGLMCPPPHWQGLMPPFWAHQMWSSAATYPFEFIAPQPATGCDICVVRKEKSWGHSSLFGAAVTAGGEKTAHDRYDTYGLDLAVEKSVSARFTTAAVPARCILRDAYCGRWQVIDLFGFDAFDKSLQTRILMIWEEERNSDSLGDVFGEWLNVINLLAGCLFLRPGAKVVKQSAQTCACLLSAV